MASGSNLVACHLLKWVHYQQDAHGREIELLYFRDIDRSEVDFVLVENRRPFRFVECKWGDAEIGLGLRYLKAHFPECEAYQVSASGVKDYHSPEGIRVCPALELLRTLI